MGELVQFAANGGTSSGYLAKPTRAGGAAVIVIQEWWGLVPHIENVCDRFAAEGFVALAPDLYHGEKATRPDDAGRLMMALEIPRAERDLAGAVAYLRSHFGQGKVGVVGFCMGGQLALCAATQNPEIGACVDFYGIHPKVQPKLKNLSGPVLGFFGEKDESVTPAAAKKLEGDIRAAGKQAEFHIYNDAGHAFFNDSRPEAHHPVSAQEAWTKMLAFFRQHLG